MNKIEYVERYAKLYDTSEYTITNKMHWNCYGSGKCWYGSECGNGYTLNVLEENSDMPHGYGCKMSPVSCNGWCTHGVSCVWYRWEVKPDTTKIASVYQSSSSLWECEITVTYKDIIKHIKLTTNNPKHDLNDILTAQMTHMPIYINSASYEKPLHKSAIVEYGKNFYNLEVSPHNMPMMNMIGDIQISKDKKVIFHTNNIICSTDSCVVKCLINEPALSRLQKKGPYLIDNDHINKMTIYGEDWVMYKVRVPGHISISFGNIELKELVVEKPHCTLEVVMSYACTGCLDLPKLVLNSKDLSREGMLPYESNCTWNRDFLSCNLEMYTLKQTTMNKYCRIYIPMINQTIDINFDYEYRGQLTSMKSIKAETTMDVLNNITSDPSFYNTLLGSFSGLLLITALSTVIIKLAKLGIIMAEKREIERS